MRQFLEGNASPLTGDDRLPPAEDMEASGYGFYISGIMEKLAQTPYDEMIDGDIVWVGTPSDVIERIEAVRDVCEGLTEVSITPFSLSVSVHSCSSPNVSKRKMALPSSRFALEAGRARDIVNASASANRTASGARSPGRRAERNRRNDIGLTSGRGVVETTADSTFTAATLPLQGGERESWRGLPHTYSHVGSRASVIRRAVSTSDRSSRLKAEILDRSRALSMERIWSPSARAALPRTWTRASPG